MEGTANIVVYHNDEVVRNTYEGVSFACENMFSFVVPCTITFAKLQYGLCQSIEADIMKRVTNILYRNEVQHDPDVQDDRGEAYLGLNDDSDEEFEATYEASDEDDDDNVGGVADLKDGKFRIRMEYGSRISVIAAIRSYTVSREVDYIVYEFKPRTFYAKCKNYGRGNFLREFKVSYLQKLVVNIGYSRTMKEYNVNYKRL
ncbi:hypothetical protein Ahy_B08g091070 [Arachis hypogaea]|uniref:Transposase MuDR plant domain-containing protein n=1 Tax=Arachis hypogaea TaxID=3818 RepID=A0A444Y1B8_ARAHY|nr:hypothetical protein Ahy_B08g091070 [Arachis hypogaea]